MVYIEGVVYNKSPEDKMYFLVKALMVHVYRPGYVLPYTFSISNMHRHAESHINRNLTDKFVLPDAGGELTTFESWDTTTSNV